MALMKSYNSLPVKVRCFSIDDRKRLIWTINSVCAEGCWMRTTRYRPTQRWEHALTQPNCKCHLLLVADNGSQPVGWCRLFQNSKNSHAEIGIGLLPGYRNKGIGTGMISRAIEWAIKNGIHQIKGRCRFNNQRAIHALERAEFMLIGETKNTWREMIYVANAQRGFSDA